MIFNQGMETLSREAMEELQLKRLQHTLRWVYERVPFYRKALDETGLQPEELRSLEQLTEIPFTQKKDLRDHYPFELLAVRKDDLARIHASSGTRGKPTVVGYTRNDIAIWAEVCARAIAAAGGKPGDLFHNAYGYGLFTGGLGLHYGAEALGAAVVPVSGGQSARQITLIEDFAPRGLAGTPSYILSLAEMMLESGVNPRETSLEYGIFGAEPWSEEMRRQLETIWGIKAVDIYGLSEVIGPGVSVECAYAQQGLHIQEDHFFPEIIDPSTGRRVPDGENGELVFTSLTKEASPIIRYRTGDIACLYREPCVCGRTTVRMSRVKGRIDDMLIIRGVNVFPSEIESVLLRQAELAPHYQLVLEKAGALDRVNLNVELADEFGESAQIRTKLAQLMKETLGITAEITILPPKSIPRSEGKAIRMIDKRP